MLWAVGMTKWSLSSKSGFNVDGFESAVARWLPEGPKWFPEDMDTDQPFEVIVAEFIREKILRSFRDEVPHSIGVTADQIEYDRKKDMYRVYAVVYVERDSQKGIIIGRGGEAIKRVGIEAREDLEQMLGCKVFWTCRSKSRRTGDATSTRFVGSDTGKVFRPCQSTAHGAARRLSRAPASAANAADASSRPS